MKIRYNVVCPYLSPKVRIFVKNVSRHIAEKIKTELLIGHGNLGRLTSEIVVHKRLSTSSQPRKSIPRYHNVYMRNFSMPFITHLTRSEARKVRDALSRLFKIKSFVRYWQPGTDGRFMKPCL